MLKFMRITNYLSTVSDKHPSKTICKAKHIRVSLSGNNLDHIAENPEESNFVFKSIFRPISIGG